ncbi:MAG: NAD(P)H-dependent oxidoreductase subunit E [Nitrospinae bacterium]|nr:NAD(P)H-dependent oxidoreductase subunit E [Nitrospinota bacterium]MZH04536.1 NAD(P)H-dependent oxidoreductase subunit E [Nitrospinota bacterium]MZH15258.1 NAD(P)H-dependent oxidoreductase subunit E [Nitrospinota bacterium]
METNTETTEEVEEIDLAPAEEIINQLPDNSRGHLIPTLDKVQGIYRYLPDPVMEMLMEFFNIARAEIYGVISFYPQLRITEPGKYIIKLCYGTACFVKGAPIINDKIHEKYHIKPGETDAEKLFTLQTASCLGNCGAAPMAIIGDDTHGTIDPEKTYDILSEYKKDDEETPVTEEVG